jgi:hypothetical protein
LLLELTKSGDTVVTDKWNINIIEKTAKIIIFISIILILFFAAFILFSELSGKKILMGYNCPIFGWLINASILLLVLVSVHEFIRTYREAIKNNK